MAGRPNRVMLIRHSCAPTLLDTDVYMIVPNWFCTEATGLELGYTIRKLLKGVPGIPQGPRLWNKKSNAIYLAGGLRQHRSEFCLYFCLKRHLILIVWVDDLFLFFPTPRPRPKSCGHICVPTSTSIPGMKSMTACHALSSATAKNKTIFLTQEPAIRSLLQRIDMHESKGKETPVTAGAKLTRRDCPGAEQAA